ncbi:MAG TPA: type II secretion system F family protein [Rhodospirillales bacterium]|nr:type II secretion system F family protein [Rhodospirillales bacterium]
MELLRELSTAGLQAGEGTIVLLAGLLGFLSMVAVWFSLVERDPTARRARLVARRQAELTAAGEGRRRRRARESTQDLATRIVKRLKLARHEGAERVRDRLMAAGYRSREALFVYLAAKLVLPFAAGAGSVLLLIVLDLGHLAAGPRLLALLGSALGGFYLPEIWLSNVTSRRLAALQKSLPDALDLLVICAEAGLALDAALKRVAEEMGKSAPELSEELALTAVELTFLPDRRQALGNLAKRVPLPMIQGVVSTLVQTERYGTPLAPSLRVLAAEFREQRIIKAEEKAARLPAILTVPLIAFILPALFIVLAGPAVIGVYDNFINR